MMPDTTAITTQHNDQTRIRGRRWRWAVLTSMTAMTAIVSGSALVGAVAQGGGQELQFSDARMIIEFNDTDQDVGVQMFVDGEPYKLLRAFDPNGRKILEIKGTNSLRLQGLTELFFESSEPGLDEVSIKQFLKRFPQGVYEIEGVTIDGEVIEGEAVFTHAIPDGPVLLSPAEGSVQDPDNTVVDWNPVPNPSGSVIKSYQVIVTQLNIAVLPKRTFSVFVPASVTSVDVPAQYMQPNTEYEFEVLAIEAGGNQTLSSSFFSTSS